MKPTTGKKGMWGDPGDLGANGAVANGAELARWVESIHAQAERVAKLLIEVEGHIEEAGRILRISQPPMIGKYDIRWWRRGAGQTRTPVLVRWIGKRVDSLRPKPVSRIREIPSSGRWAVNHKETREVLQIAQGLIATRATLRATLTNVSRSLVFQETRRLIKAEEDRLKLEDAKLRAIENLLLDSQGPTVPPMPEDRNAGPDQAERELPTPMTAEADSPKPLVTQRRDRPAPAIHGIVEDL